MANVLQDYYNRMTALNRQRGMTGNMQYGRALDASIAEGYFDSYEKNKNASRQLAIMQQNADTAKYAAEQNSKYNQRSLDFQNKALRDQQMWQGIGTGLYGIGTLAKAYNDFTANNRALPMPTTPIGSDPMANALSNSATVGWNDQPYGSTQYTQYVPDYSPTTLNVGNLDGQYFQAQDFNDNIVVFGEDMNWYGALGV